MIIKNVSVDAVIECGERYYEAAILDQLDILDQNSEAAQESVFVLS